MKTERTEKKGGGGPPPPAVFGLGAYISLVLSLIYLRRRSRRCCLCPFLPRPAPPSIRQIPLPFLTLVEGEDVRQQNSGDVLDLMLRDAAVVGELFPPAQVAPPKKYFAAAFSRAAEE